MEKRLQHPHIFYSIKIQHNHTEEIPNSYGFTTVKAAGRGGNVFTHVLYADIHLALYVLGKLLLKITAQANSTPQLNDICTDKTLIHQVLCEKKSNINLTHILAV